MSAIVPCPDPHAPCRTGGENVWIELPLSVFPDFPAVDICVCAGVDRELLFPTLTPIRIISTQTTCPKDISSRNFLLGILQETENKNT
jgi:hypothetical protein